MAIKKLVIEKALKDIEKSRHDFIRQGGQVSGDLKKNPPKDEWDRIVIRIKKEAIKTIDEIVASTMGLTRTGWILQAIEEKLKGTKNE